MPRKGRRKRRLCVGNDSPGGCASAFAGGGAGNSGSAYDPASAASIALACGHHICARCADRDQVYGSVVCPLFRDDDEVFAGDEPQLSGKVCTAFSEDGGNSPLETVLNLSHIYELMRGGSQLDVGGAESADAFTESETSDASAPHSFDSVGAGMTAVREAVGSPFSARFARSASVSAADGRGAGQDDDGEGDDSEDGWRSPVRRRRRGSRSPLPSSSADGAAELDEGLSPPRSEPIDFAARTQPSASPRAGDSSSGTSFDSARGDSVDDGVGAAAYSPPARNFPINADARVVSAAGSSGIGVVGGEFGALLSASNDNLGNESDRSSDLASAYSGSPPDLGSSMMDPGPQPLTDSIFLRETGARAVDAVVRLGFSNSRDGDDGSETSGLSEDSEHTFNGREGKYGAMGLTDSNIPPSRPPPLAPLRRPEENRPEERVDELTHDGVSDDKREVSRSPSPPLRSPEEGIEELSDEIGSGDKREVSRSPSPPLHRPEEVSDEICSDNKREVSRSPSPAPVEIGQIHPPDSSSHSSAEDLEASTPSLHLSDIPGTPEHDRKIDVDVEKENSPEQVRSAETQLTGAPVGDSPEQRRPRDAEEESSASPLDSEADVAEGSPDPLSSVAVAAGHDGGNTRAFENQPSISQSAVPVPDEAVLAELVKLTSPAAGAEDDDLGDSFEDVDLGASHEPPSPPPGKPDQAVSVTASHVDTHGNLDVAASRLSLDERPSSRSSVDTFRSASSRAHAQAAMVADRVDSVLPFTHTPQMCVNEIEAHLKGLTLLPMDFFENLQILPPMACFVPCLSFTVKTKTKYSAKVNYKTTTGRILSHDVAGSFDGFYDGKYITCAHRSVESVLGGGGDQYRFVPDLFEKLMKEPQSYSSHRVNVLPSSGLKSVRDNVEVAAGSILLPAQRSPVQDILEVDLSEESAYKRATKLPEGTDVRGSNAIKQLEREEALRRIQETPSPGKASDRFVEVVGPYNVNTAEDISSQVVLLPLYVTSFVYKTQNKSYRAFVSGKKGTVVISESPWGGGQYAQAATKAVWGAASWLRENLL